LTQKGFWMAAVLSCGMEAVLSHGSAAALWGIGREGRGLEVSVPFRCNPRPSGVIVHRRRALEVGDATHIDAIPVTKPIFTLIDLATRLRGSRLERAIGEADKLDLVDPEALREAVDNIHRPGVAVLRKTLDRRTFVLTHSELERMFLPIARRARLGHPLTQQIVGGLRVDCYWPALGLVVEVDGLRYHRTAAQQAHDRKRDQVLVAAGMTCLRFTYAQVAFEPEYVKGTLVEVVRRLARDR
jgi:very-short-patch-repair endonuclease